MRFQSNISASAVQSGTFSGTYLITGSLQTGTTNPRVTITGAGINAYNNIGTNTFILSSADGSITINGGTITGGIIQTASSGQRIRIDSALGNELLFFSGDISETASGFIRVDVSTGQGVITITSPVMNSHALASIQLTSADSTGTVPAGIALAGPVATSQTLTVFGTLSALAGIALPYTPSGQTTGTVPVVTSGIIESTLLTLTITTGVSGGGLYEVWFQCFGSTGTVLADVYQFTLYNGVTVITVAYLKVSSITANSDGKFLAGWVTLPAFTANTITAKVKRVTGTGTLTALGSAGGPMRLTAKAVIG